MKITPKMKINDLPKVSRSARPSFYFNTNILAAG